MRGKRSYVVVKASYAVIGEMLVTKGQYWSISGTEAVRMVDRSGFEMSELQIEASDAVLIRPVGEQIVGFLAENPAFQNIGLVKAKELWSTFGESIYMLLDRGDVRTLSLTLSERCASNLVDGWRGYGNTQALQLLHAIGLEPNITRKAVSFFGQDSVSKLKADPYRLLSFCARWKQTDWLAVVHFGVTPCDDRRLLAAVEEASYRAFSAGHTALPVSAAIEHAARIVEDGNSQPSLKLKIRGLLERGKSNGGFVFNHSNIQPVGAALMEERVAATVLERLQNVSNITQLSVEEIDSVIENYERDECIALVEEQRQAIHLAAVRRFTLLTGGAGVGKTTLLKALYRAYDKAGVKIVQLALAGRAAKRMQEVTSRSASTIASFFCTFVGEGLASPSVVVIDESSMVDIVTMSRLCNMLPPHVGILMVGDPNQLMPVGPGVVLHSLVRCPDIPKVELKVVKRYGNDIQTAAASIRDGAWPSFLSDETAPISFIPCDEKTASFGRDAIANTVLRLYLQSPEETQILSARRGGLDGTKAINILCQNSTSISTSPLQYWDSKIEMFVQTGLRLGDRIICKRNLWARGLQNGSLGTIVEVGANCSIESNAEEDPSLGWALWDDGVTRPITKMMLDDLELGYAITVHKAQGSQWRRVIIPVSYNRLLDRTLLYTAITRAQEQVILLGDEDAARHAVSQIPYVQRRIVGLDYLLHKQIESTSFRKIGSTDGH